MKLRISLLIAVLALVVGACYPDYDEPQRPPLEDAGEEANITATGAGTVDTPDMIVSPLEDSGIGDVTLTLVEAVALAEQEGATSGRLDLMIAFTNNTASDVTFDFTANDYKLIDAAGVEIEPIEFSDNLVQPTVPAGETITGELTYTTLDATGTFNMQVTGYPQFVVDAEAVQAVSDDT